MTLTKEKTKITKAKFPRPRVDVALKQTESKENEILCLEKAAEGINAESKKEREEKTKKSTMYIYPPKSPSPHSQPQTPSHRAGHMSVYLRRDIALAYNQRQSI